MEVNINFLADKLFPSKFPGIKRSDIFSNGTNDNRKFNFTNLLGLQRHNFINVPLNYINHHTNIIVLRINETQYL